MAQSSPPPSHPSPSQDGARLERALRGFAGNASERMQRGIERLRRRWGHDGSYHVVTFRGMVDDSGCRLGGRVLARPLLGGPKQEDTLWDNLRNTWRRFDSEPMPGVALDLHFAGRSVQVRSDAEGYYDLHLPGANVPDDALWHTAEVRRSEGGPTFLQPVLRVPDRCRFGVISDIDDTVLESKVTDWQTAAQLTFLHNARTRKPLEGVARLYQAFQQGVDGAGPNPVFYVSASPWNLYDLLEDFFDLNDIPQGPILLRDVDFARSSLRMDAGTRSKLEAMHALIDRYPRLQWVLVGDSGQIDAELYARTIEKYPGRVLAVYIRDIDPATDSPYDRVVDGHIERIAASGVPMLRVRDSNAIAAHARELGLIAPEDVPDVAQDVRMDRQRPTVAAAAAAP
jgi:phosphatidate phosphatase APP1